MNVRSNPWSVVVGLSAACVAGCPGRNTPADASASGDAAVDASSDADASMIASDADSRAETVRAGDERGAITAGNRGDSLVLAGADALPVARGASGRPWLELGARRGGASRTAFHDPRAQRQPGVSWVAPSVLREARADGALVLASESGAGGAVTVRAARVSEAVYSLTIEADAESAAMLRLNLASDDGAYVGFGERFRSTDAKGSIVPMQLHLGGTDSGTNETHVPVPFFVNSRGYGLFVRSRHAGAFDVAATDSAVVSATFESARLELLFFVDPDPVKIIQRFTQQSGLPRLPPLWAHGHMQWRNVWRSRDELLSDARRLRAEGIPTTTIWIDNPWQRSYNDSVVDEARFPDPPSMFRELAALGYRVLVWHTPYLDAIDADGAISNPSEELFGQLRDRGQLVRYGHPPAAFVSPANTGNPGGMQANGAIPDFTQPAASALWSGRLQPVISLGVRAFKLDYGEDIVHEVLAQRPQWSFAMHDDPRTAPSLFPQWYHRAYRTALDEHAGGDGFLLVRASSWGGQAVCDIIWPGDLDNDFARAEGTAVGGLPAAVAGLVNLSASGFPSFASDTGGYRGGTPTREALLRWAEHSALAPFMQLGGGGESHNPWQYDAEATRIYRDLARLHDALIPYFRTLAIAASRDGTPPVRALSLAFPSDRGARSDGWAYLLGDDLYAVPVIEPGVTQRRVHVPPGTWVHWSTREAFTGPTDVMMDAPLGRPLLFVRQSAVIPLLAEDVATLAATDDPTIVDATDRASVLRARVVAGALRSITVADGSAITAQSMDGSVRVQWQPGREASELRLQIDWQNRLGAMMAPPATVSVEGGAALAASPLADVRAGVCTSCWAFDPASRELFVTVRGAQTVVAR